MAATKYEELQRVIRDYGAAAFENLLRCKAFGEAVIAQFHDFLGCDRACVAGVPIEGPFDPRRDYGEAAFSFHGRDIIILEPVRFGISLIVKNVEDAGALWLRTVVSVEVTGDTFDVYVGSQPLIRVSLEFDGGLKPVFEAIHREFLDTFELEVLEFNDERFSTRIGFLPD